MAGAGSAARFRGDAEKVLLTTPSSRPIVFIQKGRPKSGVNSQ
jgi:hypothetical protein